MPPLAPEQHARRALGDLLAGTVILTVTAAGWMSLRANRTLATFDFGTDPGPALMPRLLLAGLGAGGLALAGRAAWRLVRSGGLCGGLAARSWAPPLLLPTVFVASLVVYLAGLPVIGFRLATFAFCTAWVFALTHRRGRPPVRAAALALAAAAVITGAVYSVFAGFVKVPLP
ncbi:MAG: tripartite tricarboxylate transporter TctB family protein [Armatimonadota bacterium]|nr:tripartite tricarboxylate transporter TctB family protein [Armatimonadota bacterium]MDR7549601.1 tripartite tricarboxylate transporter TctB family protein [Armatimonadota bacterium]